MDIGFAEAGGHAASDGLIGFDTQSMLKGFLYIRLARIGMCGCLRHWTTTTWKLGMLIFRQLEDG